MSAGRPCIESSTNTVSDTDKYVFFVSVVWVLFLLTCRPISKQQKHLSKIVHVPKWDPLNTMKSVSKWDMISIPPAFSNRAHSRKSDGCRRFSENTMLLIWGKVALLSRWGNIACTIACIDEANSAALSGMAFSGSSRVDEGGISLWQSRVSVRCDRSIAYDGARLRCSGAIPRG